MAEVVNLNLRSVRFNPTVDNGSDTRFLLELRDPTGGEFDFTGYTAKMEIRPYPKSATIYDTLTTENKRLVITDSDIEINFPASVTAKYKFSEACYDLLLLIDGHQWRVAEGLITFRKGVTNG